MKTTRGRGGYISNITMRAVEAPAGIQLWSTYGSTVKNGPWPQCARCPPALASHLHRTRLRLPPAATAPRLSVTKQQQHAAPIKTAARSLLGAAASSSWLVAQCGKYHHFGLSTCQMQPRLRQFPAARVLPASVILYRQALVRSSPARVSLRSTLRNLHAELIQGPCCSSRSKVAVLLFTCSQIRHLPLLTPTTALASTAGEH
eukprot:COSAG01_NODE_13760_length_1539_cov_0.856250_2_plen_203_part_00